MQHGRMIKVFSPEDLELISSNKQSIIKKLNKNDLEAFLLKAFNHEKEHGGDDPFYSEGKRTGFPLMLSTNNMVPLMDDSLNVNYIENQNKDRIEERQGKNGMFKVIKLRNEELKTLKPHEENAFVSKQIGLQEQFGSIYFSSFLKLYPLFQGENLIYIKIRYEKRDDGTILTDEQMYPIETDRAIFCLDTRRGKIFIDFNKKKLEELKRFMNNVVFFVGNMSSPTYFLLWQFTMATVDKKGNGVFIHPKSNFKS